MPVLRSLYSRGVCYFFTPRMLRNGAEASPDPCLSLLHNRNDLLRASCVTSIWKCACWLPIGQKEFLPLTRLLWTDWSGTSEALSRLHWLLENATLPPQDRTRSEEDRLVERMLSVSRRGTCIEVGPWRMPANTYAQPTPPRIPEHICRNWYVANLSFRWQITRIQNLPS
jgi:hypothetical protein